VQKALMQEMVTGKRNGSLWGRKLKSPYKEVEYTGFAGEEYGRGKILRVKGKSGGFGGAKGGRKWEKS